MYSTQKKGEKRGKTNEEQKRQAENSKTDLNLNIIGNHIKCKWLKYPK